MRTEIANGEVTKGWKTWIHNFWIEIQDSVGGSAARGLKARGLKARAPSLNLIALDAIIADTANEATQQQAGFLDPILLALVSQTSSKQSPLMVFQLTTSATDNEGTYSTYNGPSLVTADTAGTFVANNRGLCVLHLEGLGLNEVHTKTMSGPIVASTLLLWLDLTRNSSIG